jgi:flagellar biosynthesis GTPase FlhF
MKEFLDALPPEARAEFLARQRLGGAPVAPPPNPVADAQADVPWPFFPGGYMGDILLQESLRKIANQQPAATTADAQDDAAWPLIPEEFRGDILQHEALRKIARPPAMPAARRRPLLARAPRLPARPAARRLPIPARPPRQEPIYYGYWDSSRRLDRLDDQLDLVDEILERTRPGGVDTGRVAPSRPSPRPTPTDPTMLGWRFAQMPPMQQEEPYRSKDITFEEWKKQRPEKRKEMTLGPDRVSPHNIERLYKEGRLHPDQFSALKEIFWNQGRFPTARELLQLRVPLHMWPRQYGPPARALGQREVVGARAGDQPVAGEMRGGGEIPEAAGGAVPQAAAGAAAPQAAVAGGAGVPVVEDMVWPVRPLLRDFTGPTGFRGPFGELYLRESDAIKAKQLARAAARQELQRGAFRRWARDILQTGMPPMGVALAMLGAGGGLEGGNLERAAAILNFGNPDVAATAMRVGAGEREAAADRAFRERQAQGAMEFQEREAAADRAFREAEAAAERQLRRDLAEKERELADQRMTAEERAKYLQLYQETMNSMITGLAEQVPDPTLRLNLAKELTEKAMNNLFGVGQANQPQQPDGGQDNQPQQPDASSIVRALQSLEQRAQVMSPEQFFDSITEEEVALVGPEAISRIVAEHKWQDALQDYLEEPGFWDDMTSAEFWKSHVPGMPYDPMKLYKQWAERHWRLGQPLGFGPRQ